MRKQIFRKEALERLSSPEQLDQLMPITSPFGWVALGGIGLVLLMAILWSVFGTITKTVEGSGALIRIGGVRVVETPFAGVVTEVLVEIGDVVQEGQALVHLNPARSAGEANSIPVVSPGPGRVLDITVMEGDLVDENSGVLTVESLNYPLQAVVYVAASDAYQVQVGMAAHVVPATAHKGESSYLLGEVKSAGKFPATRMAMMRTLQNEQCVESCLALGPALQIVIKLAPEDSPSEIYSGVPCQALITVVKKRPMAFILPVFGSG